MELLAYTDADFSLTESIETDPELMKELGGPVPRAEIPRIHAKRVACVARGDWWLKIVLEPGGPAVGTIGIWETKWKGEPIREMGWTVLRAHQGKGVASAAGRLILERARADKRWSSVHAFPGLSNPASNAICRKLGFTPLEECELGYAGRPFPGRHWRLDLAP